MSMAMTTRGEQIYRKESERPAPVPHSWYCSAGKHYVSQFKTAGRKLRPLGLGWRCADCCKKPGQS